ncbi:MAG: hypothetical protein ACSHYF_18540 [Verrucomicrobiaceae bacterium]
MPSKGTICLLTLFLVSLCFVLGDRTGIRFINHLLPHSSASDSAPEALSRNKNWSPAERLLMHGDPSAETNGDQWKPLHLSDPSKPEFYAEYVGRANTTPDDFHSTVAALAPDNGWFNTLEASWLSRKAFRKTGEKPAHPDDPAPYEILDHELLRQSIDLLDKGLSQPIYDNYLSTIAPQRQALHSPPVDILSNITNLTLAANIRSDALQLKYCADAIAAALQEATNASEFERLEKIARSLEKKTFTQAHTLIDGLLLQAVAASNARALRHAAQRLQLAEKETLYHKRYQAFDTRKKTIKERRSLQDERTLNFHASTIMSLATPAMNRAVLQPPPLTREMLKPGLRAELALVARIITGYAFFLFSILALVSFLIAHRKDNRASFIIKGRHLLLGALIPFLLCIAHRYLFPPGILEYGLRMFSGANYFLPLLGVITVLLTAPLAVTRATHTPELSFFKKWGQLTLAGLGLLFSGLFPIWFESMFVAALLLWATLIWLVISWLASALKRGKSPRPSLAGHLAPTYLFVACLLGLGVKALTLEERMWMSHADPEKTSLYSFTNYEKQLTRVLKSELNDIGNFSSP